MSLEGLVRVHVDRAERFELEKLGTLQLDAQLPVATRIVNLSRTGCLFRAGVAIAPGTAISIGIPGIGACEAIVMRVGADGTGCAFATPLAQAAIDRALASGNADDGRAADAVRRLRRAA